MRAFLLILILLVVVALAAIATGFVDINQIRPAKVPAVTTTREGVTAKGGQTPAFEVKTGGLAIGSREATVKVPSIDVRPAGGGAPAPSARPAAPTAAPAQRPAATPTPDAASDTNAVQQ
jgi:hypothetical protein